MRSLSGDFLQKNQEENQGNFLESRRKTGVLRSIFEKAKIFALTNVCNFGFYQASNEKICLTK